MEQNDLEIACAVDQRQIQNTNTFISHFLIHDSRKKKDIYMTGNNKVLNVSNDLNKP